MSHFTSIGFNDDLSQIVNQITEKGNRHDTENGINICWTPGAGAELWAIVNEKTKRFFVNPHFSGNGRMEVMVTKLETAQDNPMDGGVYAWAVPDEANPEIESFGRYPFVFDPPAFDLVRDSIKPMSIVTVQIAAFAEQLVHYPNLEAYDRHQEELLKTPGRTKKLEVGWFIPTGLFAIGQDRHPAKAHFTGTVLNAECLTNPCTGLQFHHFTVEISGGTSDVVADPTGPATECCAGSIIEGDFWLSGQAVSSK